MTMLEKYQSSNVLIWLEIHPPDPLPLSKEGGIIRGAVAPLIIPPPLREIST
jgi:hypothetical protein